MNKKIILVVISILILITLLILAIIRVEALDADSCANRCGESYNSCWAAYSGTEAGRDRCNHRFDGCLRGCGIGLGLYATPN